MTQLIGVLCENRTKVVLISDRMVTTGDGSLAFEHEPKYAMLSSNAIVLTAGSIHEPEIIEDARMEFEGKASVRQIAEGLAKSYRNIRRCRIEQEILNKYGIQTFSEFHEKQKLLHEDTNLKILSEIEDYESGVAYIVGGVDQEAHIYYIDEGICKSFDVLGFCCTGSGDRHAEPVFAFYDFNPSISVSNALLIAYAAKKRSEMAGGVGKKTDAWIINKEGCYEIDQDTISRLQMFHDKQESVAKFHQEIEFKPTKLEYKYEKTRNKKA